MSVINMKLVKVSGNTRKDLLTALASLGEMDCDFSGENGIEYMWTKVWNANGFKSMKDFEEKYKDKDIEKVQLKYESNMEYLLDTLKDEKTDKELIEKYITKWIKGDDYYYDYVLDVIYDKKGKAECIALATMS